MGIAARPVISNGSSRPMPIQPADISNIEKKIVRNNFKKLNFNITKICTFSNFELLFDQISCGAGKLVTFYTFEI